MSGPRVLLLGPNGQLGHDLQTRNEVAGSPLELVSFGRDRADLSDIEAAIGALRSERFDVLFNGSSYHKTDEVEANAQLGFTINAHLVKALAGLCAEKNARFVHVSTDYVFGGQAGRSPLVETDARAPLNIYGASKAMGEDLARLTHADTLILRVASLFGVAGASGKGGNFVETMLRFGKERGLLKVVDDQIMSPTATADIADAAIALLTRQADAGVYHVVNDGQASWFEFAREIIARSGVAAKVEPIPSSQFKTPAMRPPYSVLSNAKLTHSLGRPMPHWTDALDRYLKAKGHVV